MDSEKPRLYQAVPGLDLYIGGEALLDNLDDLDRAGITHILSVMPRLDGDARLAGWRARPGGRHRSLVLPALDSPNQDLLQHFPAANAFIRDGLFERRAGVLVHCSAGISRSPTCAIAFLLSTAAHEPGALAAPPALAAVAAAAAATDGPARAMLDLLRTAGERAEACPNEGFADQLEVYAAAGCPADVAGSDAYHRWLYRRELDTKVLMLEAAPDADKIFYSDRQGQGQAQAQAQAQNHSQSQSQNQQPAAADTVRCRKCRRVLATSSFVIRHDPPAGFATTKFNGSKKHHQHLSRQLRAGGGPDAAATAACTHLFLEPLSWMRPALSEGQLEGRLECPNERCGANVGKYNWKGMPCSCLEWVVPAISLSRAKVDEQKPVLHARAPAGQA